MWHLHYTVRILILVIILNVKWLIHSCQFWVISVGTQRSLL